MKKILSLFLSVLLLMTLGVPAAAADSDGQSKSDTDQRLAQVTAKVKKTLGIGDEYTSFSGDLWENELASQWELRWSREEDSISVTATEDGKIISYYFSENEGGTAPAIAGQLSLPPFPAVGRDEAKKAAEAFMKKVLDASLESASFAESTGAAQLNGSHRFGGTILLNGLPSPMSFSVSVRASDGKITRFYRDSLEESVIGSVPSGSAAASKSDAGALLKGTLSLRLEYVLGEDGKTASLRYLPGSLPLTNTEWFVDARSGELVNLTELYEQAAERGVGGASGNDSAASTNGTMAAPEAAADAGGLSQAELEGISKLEGVLPKEDLDKEVRKTTELGLGKYTLASAAYSLNEETGEVTARLSYTYRDDNGVWRRNVSCDARSGELKSVWSSAPYVENRKASISQEQAQEKAETFLKKLWGEEFSVSTLYNSTPFGENKWNTAHSFTYVQQEEGYCLASNCLSVSVDAADGSISGLDRQWVDNVAFESPEGTISDSDALQAWFDHYDVTLAYQYIPVKLDLSREDIFPVSKLIELGYTWFYNLRLTYTLQEPAGRWYTGVDAKTGEAVSEQRGSAWKIAYNDLSGHWAQKALEALAEYNIGWAGDSCQPDKELTQIDLIALMLSVDGYRFKPEDGSADDLYRYAYSMGILTAAERDDSKVLTRGETVRILLDCAGYGSTAKLQGIFTCSYTDKDSIPADLLGYAALAQGLGIVYAGGSFAADSAVTRAQAATMLYNYMSR